MILLRNVIYLERDKTRKKTVSNSDKYLSFDHKTQMTKQWKRGGGGGKKKWFRGYMKIMVYSVH